MISWRKETRSARRKHFLIERTMFAVKELCCGRMAVVVYGSFEILERPRRPFKRTTNRAAEF
jgi:hypothetical protein